jgi:5-methylcytosine-specific restriction endonuclease McrA
LGKQKGYNRSVERRLDFHRSGALNVREADSKPPFLKGHDKMPFTEAVKLEAKQKAHFACVVCRQPFVEVHHILPQANGGSNDLDNAAPLCASCHDLFGGNPDKRKQIREMRDLWYELCATRFKDSPSIQLNKNIDEIKTVQSEHGAMLSGIKGLLENFYTAQTAQISTAITSSQVSSVSGVCIPEPYTPPNIPHFTPRHLNDEDMQMRGRKP